MTIRDEGSGLKLFGIGSPGRQGRVWVHELISVSTMEILVPLFNETLANWYACYSRILARTETTNILIL